MSRASRIAILAAALPLFAASAAHAAAVKHHHAVKHHVVSVNAGIGLAMDHAKLVSFPRPVKTVFVGNPTIVDVNLVDAQHAFVLGKTFGMTNIIALDANGREIDNREVTVVNHQAAMTIYRGDMQFNYACTHSHCETQPRPGDPKQAYFDNTEQAVSEHEELGNKAAAPPANQTAQIPND